VKGSRYCRVFLEEQIRVEGEFSDQLEDDVTDLGQIVALGTKEADQLRDEVVSKIYRCALYFYCTPSVHFHVVHT
jgi:hypothetical protein